MSDLLLVTVDSLRADHVGWHDYDRPTTPNLDTLAGEAHTFTNAFAHAGSTRPSFPSILTSSYPLMYGGPERLSTDRTIVSEALDDVGYTTAGFHSNLFLSAEFGYDRGFDHFFDAKSDPSVSARLRQFVKQGIDNDSRLFKLLKTAFDATERHAGVEVGSAYVDAADLTDRVLKWVARTDPSADHFLWVHYMDVHHPYLPPAKHQRPFRDKPIGERRATALRRRMLEEPDSLSEDEHRALVDLYDAEIRYFDAEFERLRRGVSDHWGADPVTVVTADHGEEFRDHGSYSHGTLHDEGIHVPLLLADGSDGGSHDELVGLLDVAPTVAGYAGIKPPANWYGYDLRRLLADGEWPRDAVLGGWGDLDDGPELFYRDHEWKYIRSESGSESLYDLRTDPSEHEDLVVEAPPVLAEVREWVDNHEAELRSTHRDLGDVEMDPQTKERLAMLGYREE